jgi:hypothetical protein
MHQGPTPNSLCASLGPIRPKCLDSCNHRVCVVLLAPYGSLGKSPSASVFRNVGRARGTIACVARAPPAGKGVLPGRGTLPGSIALGLSPPRGELGQDGSPRGLQEKRRACIVRQRRRRDHPLLPHGPRNFESPCGHALSKPTAL